MRPSRGSPGRAIRGGPGGAGRAPWLRRLVALAALSMLSACAAHRMPPGPGPTAPRLEAELLIADDGMALPLRRWLPAGAAEAGGAPRAVILALHGFNDYSNAFAEPGAWLAARGIATYAYDQRGFGESQHSGLWAGSEALARDALTALDLLAARYPDTPLFLLGESMGGAVAIAALTRAPGVGPDSALSARTGRPPADGLILSAPAVWGRSQMPLHQRVALWLAARLMPSARLTGRGLGIQASDNIEMLRGLGRDPLVIKATRVDAMDGLTDLMSEALTSASALSVPALVLYGAKDEVVPRKPMLAFWRGLPQTAGTRQRTALYDQGWHMLLRDLQAERVLTDIAHWIGNGVTPLPSGADRRAKQLLAAEEPPGEALGAQEAPAGGRATASLRGAEQDISVK